MIAIVPERHGPQSRLQVLLSVIWDALECRVGYLMTRKCKRYDMKILSEPYGQDGGQAPTPTQTLAETVAARIRDKVISGRLTPGSHLSELALSEELQVSRNTLREVFRLLTKEGLLRHEANRGVFVSTPSISTIMDIYRVRRMIECRALEKAHPSHPGARKMRAAVETAQKCRQDADWLGVGSADIAFHSGVVELADSPRVSAFFFEVSLELRLVFGLLRDPEFLHAPFIDQNLNILKEFENGQTGTASQMMEAYLDQAERFILGAYERIAAKPQPQF